MYHYNFFNSIPIPEMVQTLGGCPTMNNQAKNTFVKKRITEAIIELLAKQELSEISISQLTNHAQVSRNSFYRNYLEKEDILLTHINYLISTWQEEYQQVNTDSNAELYGNLFLHLKENSDFYLLLKSRNLFHLFQQVFIALYGPKEEHDNMAAYVTSFIAHGTYGWIEEWIARGMEESADQMSALLSSYGMK
jgi:AcrR family transcriptional regulator